MVLLMVKSSSNCWSKTAISGGMSSGSLERPAPATESLATFPTSAGATLLALFRPPEVVRFRFIPAAVQRYSLFSDTRERLGFGATFFVASGG